MCPYFRERGRGPAGLDWLGGGKEGGGEGEGAAERGARGAREKEKRARVSVRA